MGKLEIILLAALGVGLYLWWRRVSQLTERGRANLEAVGNANTMIGALQTGASIWMGI